MSIKNFSAVRGLSASAAENFPRGLGCFAKVVCRLAT
jgi:hypothetical protein